MMKVHRVRTKTLWPFLAAFSGSASVPDIREVVEEAGLLTLFDELGMESEGGGACLAGGLEGSD
jgi:hypothetical protein